MALTDLLRTDQETIETRHVSQLIAFAGEGKLRDGNQCSEEFRALLGLLPSRFLKRYADECLAAPRFDDSGSALQDVVNEMGRRLGFQVTNGRYRGAVAHVGFDGLWQADGHAIVVESKTTDAYQIDLRTVSGYRRALIRDGTLDEESSSVLLVVGRQATDALEAQIRGSRGAWDTRMISLDALSRLIALKEDAEEPNLLRQIREVLRPKEFTKLDAIIELIFSSREDIRAEETVEDPEDTSADNVATKRLTPVDFNEACMERIAGQLSQTFVRQTRALYKTPDSKTTVYCAVSKEHVTKSGTFFWFALHPHHREQLDGAQNAYVSFGCGSPDLTLLISYEEFKNWIDGLWITQLGERFYWHVKVGQDRGRLTLHRKSGYPQIDVTKYALSPVP